MASAKGLSAERLCLTVICAVLYTAGFVGIVALLGGPMNQTWIAMFFGADLASEWRYWGRH